MNKAPRVGASRSPCTAVWVFCGLALLSDHAAAWSRMGEVEVTDHGGRPCFGLPSKERKRIGGIPQVSGVEVHEANTNPLRRLWHFSHDHPASIPLPAQACILYGQAPANVARGQTALPLQPGRLYDVSLHATRTGPTQGHTARFCLKPNADGSLRAIQVHYDKVLGWSAAACRP